MDMSGELHKTRLPAHDDNVVHNRLLVDWMSAWVLWMLLGHLHDLLGYLFHVLFRYLCWTARLRRIRTVRLPCWVADLCW